MKLRIVNINTFRSAVSCGLFALVASSASFAQTFNLQKRNTDFSIDGNQGASELQQVYLWQTNNDNVNQQWDEISRGNGYYSYRKHDTSMCLDGGDGGARRQAVVLWYCDSDDQNQHWRKVSATDGSFRLEKRNSSGYSIDGNKGADFEQSLYLWDSNNDNINQQWVFRDVDVTVQPLLGDIRQHDFNDGSLGPFTECTVKSPNYSKVVNNRVKTYWEADAYDGTRTARGAEFCEVGRSVDPDIELRTKKHYWSGFTLNIDKDHSRTSNSAIAQTMGYKNWDSSDKFNTWSLLLSIIDGDLVVDHRPGAGTSTQSTIVNNFSFGVDHDIVIGQIFSGNNNGMVEVWVNGERLYYKTGINNGMGPFDDNDYQGDESHSAFKLGMYNHTPDDYESGEKRIVYYDNVTWYTGPNGYSIVDPSNSEGGSDGGEQGSISASASSDDGNGPANVLDNDVSTRWSALGEGEWLQVDLGAAQTLKGIQLAFFKGDQRNASFDVQVSNNGSTWNTVLSNQIGSGNSLQLESFYFSTVSARYIRYLGRGNSVNSWNSLTEVAPIATVDEDAEIVNSGVAGHNTVQMLSRINSSVLDLNPTTTLVMAGTNDMINSGKLVDFDDFEDNLNNIITQISNVGSKLVLMTIPPVVESELFKRHDASAFDPYGPNGRVLLANDIVRKVASERNIPLIDMYNLFNNNMSLISSDGVHPSPAGYEAMVDLLYNTIALNNLPVGKLVCFGDSISRNYTDYLRDRFSE